MDVNEFGRCECCGSYVKEEELRSITVNGQEQLWCIDCCYDCP